MILTAQNARLFPGLKPALHQVEMHKMVNKMDRQRMIQQVV